MLFTKKTKSVVQTIGAIIALLVIISMIASGLIFVFQ